MTNDRIMRVPRRGCYSEYTVLLIPDAYLSINEGGSVNQPTGFLNRYIVPPLTALSENTYMSAIRAGMVSVVPLTIIGGCFMIVAYLPIPGWETRVAPYLPLLQI